MNPVQRRTQPACQQVPPATWLPVETATRSASFQTRSLKQTALVHAAQHLGRLQHQTCQATPAWARAT